MLLFKSGAEPGFSTLSRGGGGGDIDGIFKKNLIDFFRSTKLFSELSQITPKYKYFEKKAGQF